MDATQRLLEAATEYVLAAHLSSSGTDETASPDLTDALVEFADVLDQNEPDRFFTNLAISLMYGVGVAYPHAYTIALPVVTNLDDGTPVSDPDSEVQGDIEGMAALAAARFVAAACSRDVPTAVAVFETVEGSGTPDLLALFTRIVLHQAARVIVAAAAGTGGIEAVPFDARDLSPDDEHLMHPHGDAAYGVTIYPMDHEGITRDDVVQAAHALLAEQTADTLPLLCGVEHSEDVPDDGLPHTARTKFQEILAERRAQGGEWAILRVWQHYGPCPTP
jgi:hypothetical protein